MTRHAAIMGNGLAGSLLAVLLAHNGWKVTLFERRPDPRAKGYGGGRSINLALSARGLAGLAAAGLEQMVRERDIIPMPGRMMHAVDGRTTFQPYSKDPRDAINSVSRGGLNLTLITAAAGEPGVEMVFDATCTDVLFSDRWSEAIVRDGAGNERRVRADLIVGADGAFSAVRGAMQKTDRFEYSQSWLGHGYKELHIPPRADGTPAMEPHALHIWPRGGAMMIALPNRDGSFTCTLFWPYEGEHSFASLGDDEAKIRAHFEKLYGDGAALMPTLVEDYKRNPIGSLVTVRCRPWSRGGDTVLVGDAAHAIVPFYGQGINCGFEDCVELARCLREHRDRREALRAYEGARKPNADAIADMALDNFVEMRDKVGRPEFLYRKRVEQALHAAFPDRCQPQYNLVSFSTVPYTVARERGDALNAVIDAVVARVPMEATKTLAEDAWRERVREAGAAALGLGGATAGPDAGLIDISPPLTPSIGVWPGDTPLTREVLLEVEKGATVTLSTMRSTVHLGSHADGSNHYSRRDEGGTGVGVRPLSHYIGPCRVLEAKVARTPGGTRVGIKDVVGLEALREPRVLIKTGTFPDAHQWNSDFAGLSVELIEALASRGVTTIGVDTPSVDTQESKDLPAHKAILRHDISILEGLVLAHIEPGAYELIAAPLRLVEFDASPVRAVLRKF
jgi:kynurenine 3-monooxygenase